MFTFFCGLVCVTWQQFPKHFFSRYWQVISLHIYLILTTFLCYNIKLNSWQLINIHIFSSSNWYDGDNKHKAGWFSTRKVAQYKGTHYPTESLTILQMSMCLRLKNHSYLLSIPFYTFIWINTMKTYWQVSLTIMMTILKLNSSNRLLL
jgi:hypothetical protein